MILVSKKHLNYVLSLLSLSITLVNKKINLYLKSRAYFKWTVAQDFGSQGSQLLIVALGRFDFDQIFMEIFKFGVDSHLVHWTPVRQSEILMFGQFFKPKTNV